MTPLEALEMIEAEIAPNKLALAGVGANAERVFDRIRIWVKRGMGEYVNGNGGNHGKIRRED